PSDVLPYRLTIVFDSFLPADTDASTSLRLQAPQLVGMQVQQSLWGVSFEASELEQRISGPLSSMNAFGHPMQPCDPWRAEFARLETAAQALEDIVSAQGSNVPASVIAESFVRWQRALNVDRQRLLDMLD